MAGDWIKWMKGLERRREVVAVARDLGLDRRIVACLCMELWCWADDNTTTGFADGLTTDIIDSLLGVSGFASALAASGWLDVRNDGIQVPRWERWNGQSAKTRALASNRQSRKRHAGVTPASRKKRDGSTLLYSSPVSTEVETNVEPPKTRKFKPPTTDEVRAYCAERKNDIDAESFVAYYESQGWKKSNGAKVSDWKLCVVTWEKRKRAEPNGTPRLSEKTKRTVTNAMAWAQEGESDNASKK